MEVTYQLHRDQFTQAGLAQVQVTCCWDGQRTKFGTGQNCLPKSHNPHSFPMFAPRLALRLLLWTGAIWVGYWLLALLLFWIAPGDSSQGIITLLGYGLIYATMVVLAVAFGLVLLWGLIRVVERL